MQIVALKRYQVIPVYSIESSNCITFIIIFYVYTSGVAIIKQNETAPQGPRARGAWGNWITVRLKGLANK